MWVLFRGQDHISELREGGGQSWSRVGMRTDVASPLRPLGGDPMQASLPHQPCGWGARPRPALQLLEAP